MYNKNQKPMTDEEIQRVAPSVFAGQPYQDRSDKYSFVSTADIITAMRGEGFFPMSVQVSRCKLDDKRNFAKHMVRFRQLDFNLTNVGDLALETCIVNSHDGTSSYIGHCGLIRFACLNGLIVSDALIASFRVRHVGNIVQSILEANADMVHRAPQALEVVKLWKTIMLTPEEQNVFAESAHILRFEEGSNAAQLFTPESLLTVRRYADNGGDLWSTFNRVQENVVRGGKVRVPGSYRPKTIRSVTGIDESTKLNKALWTLAEKMAELKGDSLARTSQGGGETE
jgi:hypothetical protein